MLTTNGPAIEAHGLSKVFGERTAVDDVSLTVERGEVFGFLGPNGAGKTTCVKMFLGLISPTSGAARLLGAPVSDHRARARVGFLPEHFRFHDWLTATEFLTLHAQLYRIPEQVRTGRISELLELVGLSPHAEKKLREYSKGMLQRVGLAQALLNDPELVFLDEPTSGLDPLGRRLVRDIIRDERAKGTAVFLNSHLLSEVEITCDRVAFIKHGRIVSCNPVKGLLEGAVAVEARVRNLGEDALAGLARWSHNVRLDGENLTLTLSDESELPALHRYLVEKGVELYSLHPQHVSLEELFIRVVGEDGGL
jgi:ABC-2 type transport system ATP-binding protein